MTFQKTRVCSFVTLTVLLAACTSVPRQPFAYDDTNKGKGEPSPIPAEFQNGTATLAQAKAWYYSICVGNGPVQCLEGNLTPDDRPAVFLHDASNEGTGGPFYMVFDKTSQGLKYIGNIAGGFRALPPDPAGHPRLVSGWHMSAQDCVLTLYTLEEGQLTQTAERYSHSLPGDAESQLLSDLFDAPIVSAETIKRAFPAVR
jgi:hypothetical protein